MIYFLSYYVFSILLILSCSQITINQPCYFHNKSLPAPIYAYQIAYFQFNGTNKVYLFGGGSTTNPVLHSSIYKWDINKQNEWFTPISATTPSAFYAFNQNAVVIGNKAYFIGMYDGADQADSGAIYIFNLLDETFIDATTDLGLTRPTHRGVYGCLTTNSSHIFMIGARGGGQYHPYTQIYDINTNSWYDELITLTPLKYGWVKQYCVFIDDTLFAFGGYIDNAAYGTNGNGIIDTFYKYTWIDKWSYLGKKSIASYQGATVYYQSYAFIVGGWNTPNSINNIDIFNTETQRMNTSNQYNLIEAVSDMRALINNEKLYVFGGYTSGNIATSSVQICDINIPTISHTSHPSTFEPTTSSPTTSNPTIPIPITSRPSTATPSISKPMNATTDKPTTLNPTSSNSPTLYPTNKPTIRPIATTSSNGSGMDGESVTTKMNANEGNSGETVQQSGNQIAPFVYVIIGSAATLCIVALILFVFKYKKLKKESVNDVNEIELEIKNEESIKSQTNDKNNSNKSKSIDESISEDSLFGDFGSTDNGITKHNGDNSEDMYNNNHNVNKVTRIGSIDSDNRTIEGPIMGISIQNEGELIFDRQLTGGDI